MGECRGRLRSRTVLSRPPSRHVIIIGNIHVSYKFRRPGEQQGECRGIIGLILRSYLQLRFHVPRVLDAVKKPYGTLQASTRCTSIPGAKCFSMLFQDSFIWFPFNSCNNREALEGAGESTV